MAIGKTGGDAFVSVGVNPGYRGLSWCGWTKLRADNNDYWSSGILVIENASSPDVDNDEQVGLGGDNDGTSANGYARDGDNWPTTTVYDMSDLNWHFLAFVWESDGTFSLYAAPIGGSLSLIGSDSESTSFTPGGIIMGEFGGVTNSVVYAGWRFWQAELNLTELEAEMASANMSAVRTSDLWGEWLLPSNSDLSDSSGNGHDFSVTTGSFTTEDDPPLGSSTSLYATGDQTIADVVDEADGTTDIYTSIDDDPDSPTDTDWINNTDDAGQAFFDVTNLPSDFGTADSAEIEVRYRGQNYVTGTVTLYARLYEQDESTPLSDEVQVAQITGNGSFANAGPISFTGLNTSAGKTTWDNARLRLRWAIT